MEANAAVTSHERLAVFLGRDLSGPENMHVQVGANLPVARAGVLLAHLTRLADIRVLLGAGITSYLDKRRVTSFEFVWDARSLVGAEALMYQEGVFDSMWRPNVFFVGGLQVDATGNTNLIGIGRNPKQMKVRGPGTVATATMATYCDYYYIIMPAHTPQSFVERCDYISALGDRRERKRLGFPGGGPRYVLSGLGILDFEAESGRMRLRHLLPGNTVDSVRAATGFDLLVADDVTELPEPSREELALLRDRIDPEGLLRR